MKYIYIIIIISLIVSCNELSNNSKTNLNSVIDATNFVFDSIITQAKHGDKFSISPTYYPDLKKQDFLNLASESFLTINDVFYMKKQYDDLKKYNLKKFIHKKYYSKLSIDTVQKGYWYYYMSPPMFTVDKKFFIVYSAGLFWVKDNIRWDEMYFLCGKKRYGWKYIMHLNRKNE